MSEEYKIAMTVDHHGGRGSTQLKVESRGAYVTVEMTSATVQAQFAMPADGIHSFTQCLEAAAKHGLDRLERIRHFDRKEPDPALAEEIVHIADGAMMALCGLGVSDTWPMGHGWVDRGEHEEGYTANCKGCIEALEAERA